MFTSGFIVVLASGRPELGLVLTLVTYAYYLVVIAALALALHFLLVRNKKLASTGFFALFIALAYFGYVFYPK